MTTYDSFISRTTQFTETCPVQFQKIYLEQLSSPISPEQQAGAAKGNRFHLLMQQRELGLPIESLLQEDEELGSAIASLLSAAPEIAQPQVESCKRYAEHCRTLSFGGYLLTVIYDLLIMDDSRAKIMDWKTYLQPQNQAQLASNWQTRLYLYILAETTSYLPEQIEMIYWFVKPPHKPESLTFTYNSSQHEETREELTRLLSNLDGWLEANEFPHLPNCQYTCPYYTAHKDHKGMENNWIISIDSIEEVSL